MTASRPCLPPTEDGLGGRQTQSSRRHRFRMTPNAVTSAATIASTARIMRDQVQFTVDHNCSPADGPRPANRPRMQCQESKSRALARPPVGGF